MTPFYPVVDNSHYVKDIILIKISNVFSEMRPIYDN